MAQAQPATGGSELGRERPGDGRVVDDRRLRRVQRAHTGGGRLDLAQPVGVDEARAGHAVGHGAGVQVVEPGRLHLVEDDDHLAALVVGDVVPLHEVLQQTHPAPAQRRLEAARLVVEAGVDDPAVVPGLVGGEVLLLVEQGHLGVVLGGQVPRDGSADDPAADDGRAQGHDPLRGTKGGGAVR